jgi:hypothetical protein
LAELAPLVNRIPALRAPALKALGRGGDRIVQKLLRLHHDASFVASGQVGLKDVMRIGWGMRR